VSPIESSFGLLEKAKDLHEMASTGKELASWSDKYIFAEVHYQLGWPLRSWLNQGIKLEKLFGPIQDDEPHKGSK
jgi:hypothetical protein